MFFAFLIIVFNSEFPGEKNYITHVSAEKYSPVLGVMHYKLVM